MDEETLLRIIEENMSFEIPLDFRHTNAKILVTVGEKEKTMMKKSAEDIVNMNSNCIGIMIPKMGHGVPMAMPDFFNHMIEAWIGNGSLPIECKEINRDDSFVSKLI